MKCFAITTSRLNWPLKWLGCTPEKMRSNEWIGPLNNIGAQIISEKVKKQ